MASYIPGTYEGAARGYGGKLLAMHIQFRIPHLFKRLPSQKFLRFFHRHCSVFYFFQNFLHYSYLSACLSKFQNPKSS